MNIALRAFASLEKWALSVGREPLSGYWLIVFVTTMPVWCLWSLAGGIGSADKRIGALAEAVTWGSLLWVVFVEIGVTLLWMAVHWISIIRYRERNPGAKVFFCWPLMPYLPRFDLIVTGFIFSRAIGFWIQALLLSW